MGPRLLKIIIINGASPLLGSLHALKNPSNIFITSPVESWKTIRFGLRIPQLELNYGICAWIQVSLMAQITGFHNLSPIQTMKNGPILPHTTSLHLHAKESRPYACLDWVPCYSSIYKTLRAVLRIVTVFFHKKPGKNLKFILSPFPTIVSSSLPASLLAQNVRSHRLCFLLSQPKTLWTLLQEVNPSLPLSLFTPEAAPLASVVLWHCWSIVPYRTFFCFLVFLLPCWLTLLNFPKRLFSIYP